MLWDTVKKLRGMEKRRAAKPALTALFFLLFLFLVNSRWPRGKAFLEKLTFSGDRAVTAAALEDLSRDLRQGEDLTDALEAFCKTVMANGQPHSP